MRDKIIEWILREKVIAIVRGVEAEKSMRVAQALYDGGIRLMEITYDQRSPEDWQTTANAIGTIAERFEGRMFVGAGTVTCPELVELTKRVGGQFAVAPDTNPEVIRKTLELGLVSIPGAMTPTEILTAHRLGADFVKVFPLGDLGAGYLKSIRAPISHVKLLATCGITDKNIAEYIAAGADAAGVGGNLANRKWIENEEYYRITDAAKTLLKAVHGEN